MNKTKKPILDSNQQKQLAKKANGAEETVPVGKKKEKEKRRNNEKRKEKSRDAARTRRSRETEIFNELAAAVPMRPEDIEHLDKASVMRLAIAFLKSRGMVDLFPQFNGDKADADRKSTTLDAENATLKSLDGFLLVLSSDGDITYVSENIADFLGLSQIDLLGQPIWDYCHQCDHDELREALNGRKTSPSELLNGGKKGDCSPMIKRDFFLRLKCTLTSRGRSVNIKSASYKVIHVTGHMVTGEDKVQLLAIGQPLPHPSNIEVPLGATTFLTKHALDMKFSYVDDKMLSLLGYKAEHLIGKSLYDFHHGADSESLMATFKGLISKGQTETSRYRFLARTGGYAWLVTQATIVYEKQKPQSVVCINYIISGVENKDEIYSCAQLAAQQTEHQPHRQQLQQPQHVDDIVKKEIVKSDEQLSVEVFTSPVHVKTRPSPVLKPAAISPPIISGVPVNSSNIRRPRSVTAAIFASAQVEKPSVQQQQQHHPPPIRGQSVTAKLFAASPSLSSLTAGQHQAQARPQNATSKIFVPRTEDMNKGYYMYCEEDTGLTMLKDEPDDLTHLAPTAGDACISIDEATPFFSDMFDDFIIPDHYNTLLSDEINALDNSASAGSKINNKKTLINPNTTINKTNIINNNNNNNNSTSNNNNNINNFNNQNSITTTNNNDNYRCSSTTSNASSKSSGENSNGSSDPFINYRDETSDINNSPHLLSPGLAKSPEGSASLPSLCSPNSSLPEDDFAFMTLSMDEDMDLSMRAPYIPMSEADDLPLLISDDLMWGAQPDEIKEAISQIKMNSSKTNGVTKGTGIDAKSISFNGSKTLDHSSLAALLSGSGTFNQQSIKTTVNPSSVTHNLLLHQQQQLVAGQQHEIQVHHIQIQQQAPTLHQQQLQDLIDDIKPKMGGMADKLAGGNCRMGGNNGCVDPLVLLGQAYKNNQLNQMEHNWTMNDLLQLNLNNNAAMNQQQQQQQHSPQVSPVSIKLERSVPTNKRSANIFNLESPDAKRLKSTLTVSTSPPAAVVPNMPLNEPKTSPNLLQQLMAPLTPAQRAKLKTRQPTNDTGRWNKNNNGAPSSSNKDLPQQQSQNGGNHQSSNSVLMNLLVSGCDETISLEPPELIMHDDNSRDSIHDHCLPLSPMDKPDTNQVLLHLDNDNHFLANPMIGGININTASPNLLSPTDMEVWGALQEKRTLNHNKTGGGRSARITAAAEVDNLLMELNEQEYNMDMGNDLLAALDITITAPSPTAMLT